MAATGKTLQDLFVHALQQMYYAERATADALPGFVAAAQHGGLKQALATHLEETRHHAERLEQVFASLHLPPASQYCEATDGLIKQGAALAQSFGGAPVGDAALIFAAQAIERHEIAAYGALLAWAKELKLAPALKLLKPTLDEEYYADDLLTRLAEDGENHEGAVRRAARAA